MNPPGSTKLSSETKASPASLLRGAVTSPYILLVAATLCWAGNWLVGRAVHAEIPPIALNFWRWTLAAAILAPFAAKHVWAARAAILKSWKILLALGFLGSALFHSLVYISLSHTTAINAALYLSAMPMVIVCVSWVIFRETVNLRQGVGIVLSMFGVVGILARGDLDVLISLQFNLGDLWAMAAMPIWALYTVLLKRKPSDVDDRTLLAVIAIVGVTFLIPAYAWELDSGAAMVLNIGTVATVIYVAGFASVIAFACWNTAVAQIGANKAGVFMHLTPVFTILLAMIFLGERMQGYHLVGIAFVAAGIYLTTVSARRTHPQSG